MIKEVFRKLGIDIKRYSVAQNQTARLMQILDVYQIDTVFDVGANTGQFGKELRKLGYQKSLVSFEPLADAYQALLHTAAGDAQWKVAPRCAIGADNGTIDIHIAGNSASSSILPMLDAHLKAAPSTANIGKEQVPVFTLDTLSPDYLKPDAQLFIKVDTQGYEDQVIDGGLQTMARARVIQLELSLTELYAGQKLMLELIGRVQGLGFELWGIEPAFIDSATGRMLQVDAVFCAPNLSNPGLR